MSDTQQKMGPLKQSDGDVLITHLICTTCQGPTRPGATALCGHTLAIGEVPPNRRRQQCVVCRDLHSSHVESHE